MHVPAWFGLSLTRFCTHLECCRCGPEVTDVLPTNWSSLWAAHHIDAASLSSRTLVVAAHPIVYPCALQKGHSMFPDKHGLWVIRPEALLKDTFCLFASRSSSGYISLSLSEPTKIIKTVRRIWVRVAKDLRVERMCLIQKCLSNRDRT